MTRKLQNCILNIPYANKNYFTSNKNKFEKSLILAYVTLLYPWIVPLIEGYVDNHIDPQRREFLVAKKEMLVAL